MRTAVGLSGNCCYGREVNISVGVTRKLELMAVADSEIACMKKYLDRRLP